ncbi:MULTISPECIES: type II secretion system secretin GspD [Thiomicrorhabdus]|uniref:Type II secretion system secretin GspD n=1 Tax=Thiomicrorhabdus heinhorstiae TaxID=2748010 RepID=A0ABS0BVX9_9GAMM|nr:MULTISPECIES: type II secretion system secretin GspD [Thiomicrorhabdus]MBF6057978.1 type II secretion system secretin GspD [Thiomicrorhabdus heinhorstiae]
MYSTYSRPDESVSRRSFSTRLRAIVLGVGLLCASAVQAAGELVQNFKDVDITTVIEAVAKISGQNFIIDPRVKGKVTVIAPDGMDPHALYQTLLAVLNVHGYVAVPSGDVIKIVPANLARDQLSYRNWKENSESWVSEVIPVDHVEATKLVAVLRPLVAREGHLVALAESNTLIITDTIANIQRIKSILKRVDIDTQGHYEVINVQHASAEEMAKTLKSVLPKTQGGLDVNVSFDERSNRLILSGDEQKRMMLRALVADLDVPVASEGKVQVVYLRYAKAADLVPILQKIAGNRTLLSASSSEDSGSKTVSAPVPVAEGAAGEQTATVQTVNNNSLARADSTQLKEQISIEADERMNAVIISAPVAVVTALKNVIKQLDIRRAQVLIEAIFVEISEDKAAALGVEWAALGNNGVGILNLTGSLATILANTGNLAAQAAGINTGITIGGGSVDASGNTGWGALLNALHSDSSSNILATPSILTLDNEEAEILVGREVPIQTGSYTSTTSAVSDAFNTIERENVGLSLKVKPQINEGNEIYLDIDQEVSDILPKGEAVDIQTSKRQIKTKVIVGDGKVVVLGGLINEKETEVVSKVPGLGDIPGLGALFRSTDNKREKANLMVFLRPVIVRDNMTSDFYSQKKYRYIYGEQARMLQKDSGMLEGLRPKLPTLEQWKQGYDTSGQAEQVESSKKPVVIESKAVVKNESPVEVEKPASTVSESKPSEPKEPYKVGGLEVYPNTSEEILGL